MISLFRKKVATFTPNPFSVDYLDIAATIRYADKLAEKGPALTVVKFPGRKNYNIIHTANEARFQILPSWVMYRTGVRR